MAGLYDIIASGGDAKLDNHLMDAALVLVATGDVTEAAAKTALENKLGRVLTAAEDTDLSNINTELNAQPDTTAKLVYNAKVMAAGIAAENGEITDTKWRSILGIA